MIDLLIIGAGIVGSWVALHAARRGLTTAVCDVSATARDGITGRNSGVIHAGIYYAPDSLKAFHCIRGKRMLLEFCEAHGVPHAVCGKLIVSGRDGGADAAERLEAIFANATAAGAEDLEMIRRPGETYAHVLGDAAIHSKGTGVVDAAAYHKAVRDAAEAAGAMFLMTRRPVNAEPGRVELAGADGSAGEVVEAAHIVNAAGLQCDEVARLFGEQRYEIRPNRGEYYRLRCSLPYQKLIYPLPHTDSTALGVHYTFQMNGEAYAGPNSVWADHKDDYAITMERRRFFEGLANILDCYEEDDLAPGYSGLRPRLFRDGEAVRDFVLEESRGVIHLLGIESPGLTSAASLGEAVVTKITAA